MVLSRALRLSVFSVGLGAIHIVAVLAALNLTGCDPEGQPRRADALASRIELAAGNVSVQQAGGAWERAIAGLLLRRGARIKVGPGDRALIRLDDGSAVFMRHGTEVLLHPEGLRLASGEIWIDAPSREDSDPSRYQAGDVVVTAARAGLDIHKSSKGVQVYVARGLAVVRAPGGRTEVQAGQRVDVRGSNAPGLRPVAFWEDWTGGMADRRLAAGQGGAGSGRIYAIDRSSPGAPARALTIRAQHVRAVIRGGVSRTTVDQRFFNPGDRRVEGYYWFTVPEGAAVDRFALEVNGTLMEGEVVERKLAAATYERAIRTPAVDPALLEWIDGRTFRARIYPIEAHGTRRVVLSYMQLLPTVDGKQHYVYPLGSAADRKEAGRIDEFGLEVDLGEEGKRLKLATTADARVSRGGQRVSMRRSGYTPRGDFLLELQREGAKRPLQAVRVKSARNEAAYVMLRYTPDLDWASLKKVPGDVVVVVDTSAGGDDTDRQLRAEVAEAILRALSTGDRFALVTADLTPAVIYPVKGRGLAPADEASVGAALDALARVPRGGASDLGAVLNVALKRLHGASQPAVVYIGDGRATVGELSGEQLARRVTRSMVGSAARLFTIGVGASADHSLLGRLARLGGGREFRVDQAEQAVQEALRFVGSHKTPTITDLKLDVGAGLDQVFTSASGKLSRGQEVILLARTHHPLPGSVKVTGRLGGEPFSRSYAVEVEDGQQHAYVPTLWARRYLAELLGADRRKSRGAIINLGLEYALMTPHTSLLVLDSEAAYERSGIKRKPRDKLWGAAPRAALELATLPLALFGCSKGSKSLPAEPREQQADEIPDWLKKRAPRRQKGDEGKMGSRKAQLSVKRAYGLRGPVNNRDPQLAKRLAEDASKNAGVLGTVGKKRDPSQIASIFGRDTAQGGDIEDALGGLIGNRVGRAHGIGGLGIVGAGRAAGSVRLSREGRPNVKAGRATVRGSLDREIVRRVIRRHLNEVKYCYQKQLLSEPGLAGKVQLGFVIAATGQVVRSRVLQSSLGNKPVETCVASAVKRWLFPKPRGGGVVGVSYPFTFWSLGRDEQLAARERARKRQAAVKRAAAKKTAPTLRVCSDAARRPLWHRRAIWLQRLERARGVKGWTRVFRGAWSRCELPSWRDRKLLLDLVQQRVSSAAEVQVLLASLPGRRVRDFVRRRLLRRAVTRELAQAPGLADHDLDWSAAEASLAKLSSPDKRVELLRWLCDKHPGSAGCTLRLVRALIEAEQSEDALNLALRSRRAALVTPDLMEQLGDLLVASGQAALATRIYSEIVEYAPEDAAARRRLGDIYLRHGWYEPAYQQYRTLVALLPDEPLAALRLAAAAAGTGRVDEALRLERRVAAGEGEPGPNDPRRWARMLSAARIARLMLKHRRGKSETLRQSLRRSLSRLQVLPPSRGALVLLTWEDLDAPLGAGQGQDKPAARGRWQHLLDGRSAGLVALSASGSASGGALVLPVRRSGVVAGSRAVSFQVTTIRLEGKLVRVANQRGTLSPGQAKVTLTLPAPAKRARRVGKGRGGQPS